jgi:hypothetical protein
MAIIDYSDVTSGRYAKLTLSAKALIPVLATIADKETGIISPPRNKIDYISKLAGISRKSTWSALELLSKTKRISYTKIHGHPGQIIYLPIAQFSSKAGEVTITSPERYSLPLQEEIELDLKPHEQRPDLKWQIPCLTGPLKQFKTTTAADRLSLASIQKAKETHPSVVFKILDALKWFDGEIEDVEAYFWSCCRTHTIPTSAKARQRKADFERHLRQQDRQFQERQQELLFIQERERQANDPELVAASKKAIADLEAMWSQDD